MSGIPPQLDTTVGTPSQEWARSTTTAAFARTEPAPAVDNPTLGKIEPTTGGMSISSSADAQKGPFDPHMVDADVPGAYPLTPGDHNPAAQTTATEMAQNAAAQASSFVQSAANAAAQYIPQSVVDSVSAYMPNSSATATMHTARASEHDSEHKTSFPTSETTGAGAREHVGGVGSLPGPVTESGVPKLPEERTSNEQYTTIAGAAAPIVGTAYALKDRLVGSLPSQEEAKQSAQNATRTVQDNAQATAQTVQNTVASTAQNAKQAVPGLQTHSTAVTAPPPPSREPFGARPGDHSSGVGALPGRVSESNVALLPEESAHPQYDSGPVTNRAHVSFMPSEETSGNESATGAMRHVAGVGALVGGTSEEGVARLPDERTTGGAFSDARNVVKPTQETSGNETATGSSRHVGGVGALVGGKSEEGVARLPDERSTSGATPGVGAVVGSRDESGNQKVNALTADKSIPSHAGEKPPAPPAKDGETHHAAGGTKGLPNKCVEEDGEKMSREMQTDLLHANLHPRAHALGADRAHWGSIPINTSGTREELKRDVEAPGYDTDYHPAELHPLEKGTGDPHSEGEKSLGATQADANRPAEEQHPPHSGDAQSHKERKATFMDKMKGEAKVLIGKMERKQEKVEEGQRIKSGETKTTSA